MSVRKYMYLITENEKNPDDVGKIEIASNPRHGTTKNEETTQEMQIVDTGERYDMAVVSLGYHDFENEAAYRDHDGTIVRRKLLDVDDRHLEKAGIDPESVREKVEA